jgi:hypothetical protein
MDDVSPTLISSFYNKTNDEVNNLPRKTIFINEANNIIYDSFIIKELSSTNVGQKVHQHNVRMSQETEIK